MSRFLRHVLELLRQGLCFDEERVVKNCFPQGEYFSDCPRLDSPFITLPTNFKRNHLARSFSFFALTFPSLYRYNPCASWTTFLQIASKPQTWIFLPKLVCVISFSLTLFFPFFFSFFLFFTSGSILPLVPAQTTGGLLFRISLWNFRSHARSLFLAIFFYFFGVIPDGRWICGNFKFRNDSSSLSYNFEFIFFPFFHPSHSHTKAIVPQRIQFHEETEFF